MFTKLNNRGISSIFGVVGLILLSVISVSLLWTYVSLLEKDSKILLSPAVDCLADKTKISAKLEGQEIRLRIEKDQNYLIEQIRIIVEDAESKTKTYTCGRDICNTCALSSKHTDTLILPYDSEEIPQKIRTLINGCSREFQLN